MAEAPPLRIYHMCSSYVIVDKPADCRIDGDFDVTVEKLVHRELAARRAAPSNQTILLGAASPSGSLPLIDTATAAAVHVGNDGDAEAWDRERVRIRFAHRLDFATSGLLCMAFSRAAAAAAGKLFRERRVTKHYVAMVWGTMPKRPPCVRAGVGSDGSGCEASADARDGESRVPARFKVCSAACFGHDPDAERQRPKKRAPEPPPRGADGKRIRGRRAGSNFFEQEVQRLRALERDSGGQGLSVVQRQLLGMTWRQIKRDPTLARPFLDAQRADAERYEKEVEAAATAAANTQPPTPPGPRGAIAGVTGAAGGAVAAGAAAAEAAAPRTVPQTRYSQTIKSGQREQGELVSLCYVFDAPIADAPGSTLLETKIEAGAEQVDKSAQKIKGFKMAIGTPANPGRRALTQALVLRHGKYQGAPVTLLRLCLHTGRRHQIRLHLTHAGFPIVGDATYGDATADEHVPRMMLHSQVLQLPLSAQQVLNFETENPFETMLD